MHGRAHDLRDRRSGDGGRAVERQQGHAQVVHIPSTVTGTTVDATIEQRGPVRLRRPDQQLGLVQVHRERRARGRGKPAADGNLDAEIDVFKQRRSQLDFVDCDITDDQGLGAAGFRVTDGATYFIRVAEQPNSEHNTFTLKLVQGPPPAEPPGRSLKSGHVQGTLDRVLKVDAAYHLHLKAGTPYRFNLVHDRSNCQSFRLYPPGTTDFSDATPVLTRRCGGYAVYAPAPGDGGRYFVRIGADRRDRDPQPYDLYAGQAGHDDLAPGALLRNHAHHAGRVSGGGLDVRDVYRFNVGFRSQLDVHLAALSGHKLVMELRTGKGDRIQCACDPKSHQAISLRIPPGRYYVAVQATDHRRSHYVLTRKTRTITGATTFVDGAARVRVLRHEAVNVGVSVRPGATGATTLTIQHFDPFQGWLPYRVRHITVSGGLGSLRWTPPSLGRWRVRADYLGTRNFAPSESGWAHVLVARPL